jgi:hypothetical protein
MAKKGRLSRENKVEFKIEPFSLKFTLKQGPLQPFHKIHSPNSLEKIL